MNTFNLLESEGELKFYVGCSIRIMSQLCMVVKAVVFITKTECSEPFDPYLFPVPEPFKFGAGGDKVLHLHLFEFPHPENELACNNLIPESFSDLGNTKRDLHSSCFLDIQEIDENSLCCFGPEINFTCTF